MEFWIKLTKIIKTHGLVCAKVTLKTRTNVSNPLPSSTDAHLSYDCCMVMQEMRIKTLVLLHTVICCYVAEKTNNVSSPNIIILLMDDVSSLRLFPLL